MKSLFLFVVITGFFFLRINLVFANEMAEDSARLNQLSALQKNENELKKLYRYKKAIKQVFTKYHSPLVTEVDHFLTACITYKIDCYLLPSIAGTESTFGRYIYPSSHNPFGWGGGYTMFSSWKEAIETVALNLRKNYYNKGADNLWAIGQIYSESPTWSTQVQYFINQFKMEEEKLPLFLNENEVKL